MTGPGTARRRRAVVTGSHKRRAHRHSGPDPHRSVGQVLDLAGQHDPVEPEYLPNRRLLARHYLAAANLLAAATALLTVSGLSADATVVAGLTGEEAQRALVAYGPEKIPVAGPESGNGKGSSAIVSIEDVSPEQLDAGGTTTGPEGAEATAGSPEAAGDGTADDRPPAGQDDPSGESEDDLGSNSPPVDGEDTGGTGGPKVTDGSGGDGSGGDGPATEFRLTSSESTPVFDGVHLAPGGVQQRCYLLTYTGPPSTAEVVLTIDATGALGAHLGLTVETGRGTTANADCSGFVADTELATGTLADLSSAHGPLGWPAGPFTMPVGVPIPVRLTSTLPATTPESVQGLTVEASLTWTATAG